MRGELNMFSRKQAFGPVFAFLKYYTYMDKRINLGTVTGRINAKALELLEQNPDGVRWTDMLKEIQRSEPALHPKTINGCVWKLVKKFPDKVYKPEKGLFRSVKYK